MPRHLIVLGLWIVCLAIAPAPACAAVLPEPQIIDTQAIATQSSASTETASAIFAGGCFWCMEKPFDELPGVIATTSGYTGGTVENPTYKQVSSGKTGHVEAVKVTYNPAQVNYNQLLSVFWHNVDPLDPRGQFCDKGSQYRAAIFYQNDQQAAAAQASKQTLAANQFEQEITTNILPASVFYTAEEYHQNYYKTHPVRYKIYRFACGRDRRLAQLWSPPNPQNKSPE